MGVKNKKKSWHFLIYVIMKEKLKKKFFYNLS